MIEPYDDDGPDDYEDDFDDELENAMHECGSDGAGLCCFAGSEFCDWQCPIARLTGKHPLDKDASGGEVE